VSDIQETHNDCRVLVLGSGMGIIPLLALKAGAEHVTVIDRCTLVCIHRFMQADQLKQAPCVPCLNMARLLVELMLLAGNKSQMHLRQTISVWAIKHYISTKLVTSYIMV